MTKKETKQIGESKQNTCIVGKGIYMLKGNLNNVDSKNAGNLK